MRKLHFQNIFNLVISALCAVALAGVLTKSSPNTLVVVLCTFVTVLCLQVAFLRRELTELKDQLTGNKEG